MPTSPGKRTPTVTRRPADATPPDIDERLRQLQHHQQRQADPEPPPSEAPADRPESAPPVLPPAPTNSPDTPPAPLEPSPTAPSKRARNERQSRFLAANLNRMVTIYLVNGIRLTGRLTGHDDFMVILAGRDGTETLTYKHAISTVVPGLPPSSPLHRQA